MNTYQQKWIDILNNAGLQGWEITPVGDDIMVVMPHITDLKVIRDNLPTIIGQLSLDIEEPAKRLRFIIKNGYEEFDYVINPNYSDLEE
ncbi:hypothetical protein HQ865_10370 [Mucilaginibacter mali]|uniref:Uncharacterized protein n=1 Tax=Mucilaginibacter mali TaxID=2740462 RepID=A0A7D4Q391_9SPHI|nr:hypothetical protein [Mucilaginibacter mali]QKJ30147.1 hypothetical protein HQ865_10370 [Mucilaginibacter mali]